MGAGTHLRPRDWSDRTVALTPRHRFDEPHTDEDIRKLVQDKTAAGWAFAFLGANVAAYRQRRSDGGAPSPREAATTRRS